MNTKKISVFLSITLSGFLLISAARFNYIVMDAFYNRNGGKKIFRVGCETNCTTMFVLPPDELIADIIEPTGDWIINCDNKRFVYVVPSRRGVHTSLDLITKRKKIYSFILEELSGMGTGREVVKKVNIREGISRLNSIEKEIPHEDEFDDWANKRINDRYRIRDKYFSVDKVEDNGIVTRIYIPGSRIRPAVFVKKKGKRSKLGPVRYIDSGEFYIVHRILRKGERIVLKSGKLESFIYKR